jgi:hypothetical protein
MALAAGGRGLRAPWQQPAGSSGLRQPRASSRASSVRVFARRGRGDRRKPPPPDLPSLLFDQRIVYLGMPVRGWLSLSAADTRRMGRAVLAGARRSGVLLVRWRRAAAPPPAARGLPALQPALFFLQAAILADLRRHRRVPCCHRPLPPRKACNPLPPAQLVPAVTELMVAELLYLEKQGASLPIEMLINSSGTTRQDGEIVSREGEVDGGRGEGGNPPRPVGRPAYLPRN